MDINSSAFWVECVRVPVAWHWLPPWRCNGTQRWQHQPSVAPGPRRAALVLIQQLQQKLQRQHQAKQLHQTTATKMKRTSRKQRRAKCRELTGAVTSSSMKYWRQMRLHREQYSSRSTSDEQSAVRQWVQRMSREYSIGRRVDAFWLFYLLLQPPFERQLSNAHVFHWVWCETLQKFFFKLL